MKKSILLLAALFLFGIAGKAQATYNLVLFSEDGDAFFAFVNGIRQNDKPETNIKVTGLTAEALSVRVEFENKAYPKLKQNMAPESGYEHTVRIKKNSKGELKMQYFGQVALAEAPKSSATTVEYHTAENPLSTTTTDNSQQATTTTVGGNGGTTITTTTTSTQVNSNPEKVSLNINMGGAGINMNINGMDNTQNVQTTSSTTVTTTTSSSSSGTTKVDNNNTAAATAAKPSTQPATTTGCSSAMSASAFSKMKQSVEAKPFSDTKMSTAKVATKNNCLSVSQISEISKLFSMDDDKLAYAKFAYDYCVDKGNFYQISEIFSFSTTTDELNKFLESK